MLGAVAAAAGNRGAVGCHSLRRTNAEPRSVDASPQGAPEATLGTTPGAPIDQTHEPRTRDAPRGFWAARGGGVAPSSLSRIS